MKSQTDEQRELITQLGKRLKQFRIKKGYTNYEHFANEYGISRTQYGRYETGDNLKFLTLCKILDGMNVSLAEFFAEGFQNARSK
ncbi:helix-turn-helix domain-containing protein [Pedobacter deserti]|uniref:helix-turn-helix domain-containing protein n=1 Tax=Pedobacter deserti TaxID=2817382 RepID=UPI00210984A5|nr:helix-turn-helix transcriptional regulator [Pedobacter sp. SYSU D00382]